MTVEELEEWASDLESGAYELRGGLHRPESGQRLRALLHESGACWQDDLVLLGVLAVPDPDQ